MSIEGTLEEDGGYLGILRILNEITQAQAAQSMTLDAILTALTTQPAVSPLSEVLNRLGRDVREQTSQIEILGNQIEGLGSILPGPEPRSNLAPSQSGS